MNKKLIIDGVEICPELQIFIVAMQQQINNNTHKDQGQTRGWKTKSCLMGTHELGEEYRDLVMAVDHIERPIGADPRNAPTPERILKEAADVANHAMHVADQCGAVEAH